MRRLFTVDYRENGASKHQCIEMVQHGTATDEAIITACHAYVGIDNDLDCVVEVYTDMTVTELSEIMLKPVAAFLPTRLLYANGEELKRCCEILRKEGINQ